MLEVQDVHKSYGSVKALQGVDLTIQRGEVLVLLGANGAGKTTLMSVVAGLRRADRGSVSVAGIDVATDPDLARRCLGFAPQELGIYPTLTARENLTLFGDLAGLRSKRVRGAIEDVAAALSLDGLLERRAGTLSGGQQRRLHTGMAMLHRPSLLLLDEPTAGADIARRADILRVIREYAQAGAAVAYTTHYLAEVEELDAQVAILDRGRIVARGEMRELIATHGSSGVQLEFDGPPPAQLDGPGTRRTDDAVTIEVPDPSTALPRLLASLGPDVDRIRSIEMLRPSLESVFLSLTGRRYASGDEN